MNKLDKQYTDLLQDILDNGVEKKDRTGTGTLSVFGRQIRHKMSDGFPALTTKKLYFKGVVTELLWFLRGDTNIQYLVQNGCHIWDGDCYSNYLKNVVNMDPIQQLPHGDMIIGEGGGFVPFTMEVFINTIRTNNVFAKKWGDLGPIYGKQWRKWQGWMQYKDDNGKTGFGSLWYDQIARLIHALKTNPDSRRLMVNAWNVGELDQMVLPPCHYGFQVHTRELSEDERNLICKIKTGKDVLKNKEYKNLSDDLKKPFNNWLMMNNIPTRAISLMWNQRSVDTFLGLPFNIASYGLLLEIIAKAVNMVPDELIGNLGDTHLYLNHIEQAKEQIGRELTHIERIEKLFETNKDAKSLLSQDSNEPEVISSLLLDELKAPIRTREPYELPTLDIHPGILDYDLDKLEIDMFKILNYQSHTTIKAPLSN
jgi:thymidylate synthase